MTTQNIQVKMTFNGGWATDFGPTAQISPQQDGSMQIPYLVDAENCVYDLDGGPKKIGGTEKINSSALNGGTSIRGLVDYWRIGTSGSFSQHRVVHVGDELMVDSGDGSFSSIIDGSSTGELARDTSAIPSYSVFDDDLIIFSDVSAEVPMKYDGSNISVMGTNTPNCAFGVMHKNRFFMAGDVTKPSRAYYSEPLPNGADGNWDQVEAGFFDVDPNDNDVVTGFASHKGVLFIFKGPNNGSIHILAGDTPLGGITVFGSSIQPTPFKLDNFVEGVGAVWQNSIFRFRDDVGFIDGRTGSVRSLNATEQFGDFHESALSMPINDKYLLDRINMASLRKAWAANDTALGAVAITIPIDSSTTNNTILNMDYRFDPPRWSQWPSVIAECLATVIDQGRSSRQTIFIGDTSGFVRRTNTANRSIDGITAIKYKVTLPHLDFGNPVAMKTLARAGVGIGPSGDYNGTFGWERDNNAQQTKTFGLGGGDVLAGSVSSQTVLTVVESGSEILVTTFGVHTRVAGDSIVLSNMTQASYNGVYTVNSVPISTQVKVTATYVADSTGTLSWTSTANFFALGTSTLSGSRFVNRFFPLEEGGEFRSIQFQITQFGLNEDIEVHSILAEMELDADSMEA